MKYLVRAVAGSLIVAGLICLSMAPAAMAGFPMGTFIHSFVVVCFWTAVPVLILGLLYYMVTRKKK
ncbi:hypothetical protein [Ammoniphilus sp. YIM 78166]|uniref:hypothetical protein n=1 Tax=Ammoniphilus sp. YIM 78166 TaxID=1644106 RepID=UPI00106F487C|nr:hypothetical protein [Ammoniphilus sp. YIM 78166]